MKEKNRIKDFQASEKDDAEKDRLNIGIIMEDMDVDEDEATKVLALVKAKGVWLSDIKPLWGEEDPSNQLYSWNGKKFYIGMPEELAEIAKDVLKESSYLWREAVAFETTTLGLDDWCESVVDVDGFEFVLSSGGHVDTVTVDTTIMVVCEC